MGDVLRELPATKVRDRFATSCVSLEEVARLVVEGHRAAPACVVGAALWGEGGYRRGWGTFGRAWTVPPAGGGETVAPAVTAAHVFDLASLTKPIVALVFARLEQAGVIARGERLGEVVPALAETASATATLDSLAAHRAGLEAHVELFVKEPRARQPTLERALARAAAARRPDCSGPAPEGGHSPVYSDLGYILLGAALEARTGRSLERLVEDEVAAPLGLEIGSVATLSVHHPAVRSRIVPTEEVAWRGGVLRGVVHDENAWLLADERTAGHAGLFGDVASVVALGVAVLDAWKGRSSAWLSRQALEPLVAPRAGGSHAAGFDRRSGEAPSCGQHFGPDTFGHLGFTGTSIWIDPRRELVGVLLTNRVHPSRDHVAIRAARPEAYDRLFELMVR